MSVTVLSENITIKIDKAYCTLLYFSGGSYDNVVGFESFPSAAYADYDSSDASPYNTQPSLSGEDSYFSLYFYPSDYYYN